MRASVCRGLELAGASSAGTALQGLATSSVRDAAYSADPAMLRLPVFAVQEGGASSVKFECSVAHRIQARGVRTFTTFSAFDKEPSELRTDISELQSSNFWWMCDRDSAERVAKAINVLLRSQGTRESSF